MSGKQLKNESPRAKGKILYPQHHVSLKTSPAEIAKNYRDGTPRKRAGRTMPHRNLLLPKKKMRALALRTNIYCLRSKVRNTVMKIETTCKEQTRMMR